MKESMAVTRRNLIDLFDVDAAEVRQLLDSATAMKRAAERGIRTPSLAQRVLALLFEKPSLRTRVSFEAAMAHLGGSTIYLNQDVGWKGREPIDDFAQVLGRYVDAIVFRGSEPETLELLAQHAQCSVINGLTRDAHPCQALGDLLTIEEFARGTTSGKLAYVGDGNNVARSLAVACAHANIPFVIASPHGYGFEAEFLERLAARFPHVRIESTHDARRAARGASAIYTDVWVSMGDESQRQQRLSDFRGFQVDAELMSLADSRAIFLHCLPARRGEEVTEDVIASPQSAVYAQAENRLHIQKAILRWLIPGDPP